MASYSYIDTTEDIIERSNFDQPDFEYNIENFKEFSGMIKDLTEFRNQARDVTFKHNMMSTTVNAMRAELQNLDNIKAYLIEAEWLDKVDELKKDYIRLSKYEEKSEELKKLKEQKEKVQTIATEFKVEVAQSAMCCLCYDRPISVFLDPCGHVCCEECFKNIRGIVCPCCRGNFVKKKIYSL